MGLKIEGSGSSAPIEQGTEITSEGGVEQLDDLLRPPSYEFGAIGDVMILLERQANVRKHMADQQRELALKSQEAADAREIGKMREEADDILKQAITSGVMSLAGAAAQGVSVGLAFKAEAFRVKAAPDLEKVGEFERASTAAARRGVEVSADASVQTARSSAAVNTIGHKAAENWARAYDLGKTVADGASRAMETGWQHAIKKDQIEQKRHSNESRSAGRAADGAAEESRTHNDTAEKTLARLENLLQLEQQTRLAIIQAGKV